jgi:hypothetical protein
MPKKHNIICNDKSWYRTDTGHLGYDNHLQVIAEVINQFDWGQAFVGWLLEAQPPIDDATEATMHDQLSEQNLAMLVAYYGWS